LFFDPASDFLKLLLLLLCFEACLFLKPDLLALKFFDRELLSAFSVG